MGFPAYQKAGIVRIQNKTRYRDRLSLCVVLTLQDVLNQVDRLRQLFQSSEAEKAYR